MEESVFAIIGSYQYSSEAFIYKGKLESEAITVYIRDNHSIDSNPMYSNALGGIKLYVKNKDRNQAAEILSEISHYSINDNNELISCPKCKSQQINMVTSIRDLKSLLVLLFFALIILLPFYLKHNYKCNNCKFEFN